MKRIFLLLFLFLNFIAQAQQGYFQQWVDYSIKVKLDPIAKTLSAKEQFVYYNNSPDTLHFIYIHLWANAYQPGTDLAKQQANNGKGELIFGKKEYRGFIDSLDFRVNGQKASWHHWNKKKDIAILYLPQPLLPGDSVVITTPFFVKIPRITSRMGYDDKVISITQWYPKPAVYDRYGWHPIPYLDQGEFYSEFASFDVEITLPSQYAIAATGNLLTDKEKQWREQLRDNKAMDVPYPSKRQWKTVHFVQDSIHDFAFFVSDQYYARSSEIVLPHSGRKVQTWTFFTDINSDWDEAVKYVDSAVYYYSLWVGDYPYDVCTAVQGPLVAGGGMEYPTITVIGSNKNLEQVIVHEVGHNWFYGILAFNERRYPFLDEGINSFYDHRYSARNTTKTFVENILPGEMAVPDLLNIISYTGINQPLNLHSTEYSSLAYAMIVYEKTAFSLRYLQQFLGEKEFDRVMQKFYRKWKFRHPYPKDLEQCFENNATKEVQWFFKDVVQTNRIIDYSVHTCPDGIKVKNTGEIAAPMIVRYYSDGEQIDKWILLNPHQKWTVPVDKQRAYIDPQNITLDFNPFNNFSRGKIPNKQLKITMLPKFFNYKYNYLTVTPILYYRFLEGLLPGIAIYNFTVPWHKVSYAVSGFYGLKTKRPSALGFLTYQRPSTNGFPQISFSLYADNFAIPEDVSFDRLRKFSARLKMTLWNKQMSDKWRKDMEMGYFRLHTGTSAYRQVYRLTLRAKRQGKYHPVAVNFLSEYVSDLNLPLISASAEFMPLHYVSLNTGLNIRLFAGLNAPITAITPQTDYALSEPFVAKYDSTSFWRRQVAKGYGNFMLATPEINYPWSAGINITSTLPIKQLSFLAAYFNTAYVPTNAWHWEGGINLKLGSISLYFPLVADNSILAVNPDFKPLRTFYFAIEMNANQLIKMR